MSAPVTPALGKIGRIRSSRSASATCELRASLSYVRPYLLFYFGFCCCCKIAIKSTVLEDSSCDITDLGRKRIVMGKEWKVPVCGCSSYSDRCLEEMVSPNLLFNCKYCQSNLTFPPTSGNHGLLVSLAGQLLS